MKNLITILLAAIMGLFVASCSDDDSVQHQKIEIKKGVIYTTRTEYISSKGESFDYSGMTGGMSIFAGFMIDDNGLTEFQRALPGDIKDPQSLYGRVTTKDYTFNPLTGELTYEVGRFWNLQNSKRKNTIILKDKGNGELYTKGRFGILPLGFPESLESGEELVSDPDSYELITYYPLSAEKAAEWMERFPQY